MVTAFQILAMLVVVVSFLGVIGTKEDDDFRENLTITLVAGLISFIVVTLLA